MKLNLSQKAMNFYLIIQKNDIERLLFKYKHGNIIHEYGKQQNE